MAFLAAVIVPFVVTEVKGYACALADFYQPGFR